MKKTVFLAIFIIAISLSPAKAQLVIESTGRAVAGNTPISTDDADHMLTMTIQGNYGSNNSGAKLGFGDFGRYCHNGWNVFVGEFGTTDTDVLWLQGKRGIKMTALKGNYQIADWSYPDGGLPRFSFYNGVRADRLAISSDDNHKSSITNITTALSRLLQVRGVQYTYTPIDNTISVGDTGQCASRGNENITGKEAEDSARIAALLSARDLGETRYGLRTSELLTYFPDVVECDILGNQYVNYIELIPVIIAAIREMYILFMPSAISPDATSEYENIIGALQPDSTPTGSLVYATEQDTYTQNATEAILYQNTPNPFSSATEIEYYIPGNAASACIYVFNLTGELLQTYPIGSFGNGSVTISGSTLNAGMYIYSLVVDNNIVDTKRMILTK